ncbi:hypothetical protein J5I95_17380 [Candidatus Poribacteria bacterium]|nr:hypothetical protein [Candidatus Poribacteria bacterium]
MCRVLCFFIVVGLCGCTTHPLSNTFKEKYEEVKTFAAILDRSKTVKEQFEKYASKYKYGYHPSEPDTIDAFLSCNLEIKDLEHLLRLVELRLNATTLEEQMQFQRGVNMVLKKLILSIDVDAGTQKYGKSVLKNPKLRAINTLFSYSIIRNRLGLEGARDIVFETEVEIYRTCDLINW